MKEFPHTATKAFSQAIWVISRTISSEVFAKRCWLLLITSFKRIAARSRHFLSFSLISIQYFISKCKFFNPYFCEFKAIKIELRILIYFLARYRTVDVVAYLTSSYMNEWINLSRGYYCRKLSISMCWNDKKKIIEYLAYNYI